LDCHLLAEPLERILPLQFLELDGRILVKELIDTEVTSTDSDLNVVLLDLDSDALSSELVDTLTLSHEHDLELGPLGVVVDELSQLLVDGVFLHGDVDGNSLLQINDILLESFNFNFSFLQLLQQLQRRFVGLVNLLFKLKDVLRGVVHLLLDALLLITHLLEVSDGGSQLLLDIFLLLDDFSLGEDGALVLEDLLSLLLNLNVLLIRLVLALLSEGFELLLELGELCVFLLAHLFLLLGQLSSYLLLLKT